MSTEGWITITVAIITGACSVLGVILSNAKANRDMDAKLDKTQAVFEAHVTEKIDRLTEKVELHNTLIERTYALEKTAELQGAEQKRLGERIKILEGKGA